ncbi:MAG: fumarate hydratase [Armatimonadota bacterium]
MREISARAIAKHVKEACIEACYVLPGDVFESLKHARSVEESPAGKTVIDEIIENARIAREERAPICQDTGLTLVFVELGQDTHIVDGGLYDAINEGVREGYEEGYLRKSIVRHPLDRVNTGDNTPAIIHTEIVPGDRVRVIIAPKGGGSENMSIARVLKPADGLGGVRKFVVETVRAAGSNPCPPIIVGIGLGGTIEKAALLSKKAILRKVGQPSPNPIDAEIERDLLQAINRTGVGPSGLGGRVTALAVHVESYPCHIASLPVGITIQCHAARHKEFTL